MCIRDSTYTHTHTRTHTHAHTHAFTYTHIHTHARTRARTHTHTPSITRTYTSSTRDDLDTFSASLSNLKCEYVCLRLVTSQFKSASRGFGGIPMDISEPGPPSQQRWRYLHSKHEKRLSLVRPIVETVSKATREKLPRDGMKRLCAFPSAYIYTSLN